VDHKESLHSEQKPMDAAAFVDRACKMAATLEDREVFDVQSRPIARKRVARLAGVPASLLHSLRYRPPKTIAADAYARLCAAIEAQAFNQIGKAFDEIAAARARRPGVDDRALREIADALAHAHALLREGKTK
jgi:hypothetical protein